MNFLKITTTTLFLLFVNIIFGQTPPLDTCFILNPGAIGYDQTICRPGDIPDPLVNVSFPTGQCGIKSVWKKSCAK